MVFEQYGTFLSSNNDYTIVNIPLAFSSVAAPTQSVIYVDYTIHIIWALLQKLDNSVSLNNVLVKLIQVYIFIVSAKMALNEIIDFNKL